MSRFPGHIRLTAACALLVLLLGGGCQQSGANDASPAAASTPVPTETPSLPPTRVAEATPTSAAASPTAVASPPAVAKPAASPPASTPAALMPEKAAVYREVEAAVSSIRRLPATGDVELRFMSQDELRQFFQNSFDRDYTPEERARDQKLLTTLGLIRPDQDLTQIILTLLSEEVIGLYDDDTRRMYLIGGGGEPNPGAKVTFAHEFTHALQDQHFSLKSLDPPDSNEDDRSMAVQALVEGDATLTMLHYAQARLDARERREYAESQSSGQPGAFSAAPLVLREELLFPYTDGLRFVQRLHQQGGFAAVDAAFRDPPRSTEQILHPEKYYAREAPAQVQLPDLPAALGDGWRQTVTNTLGELDLRILIEQYGQRDIAASAAAGWGGDRYAFLEDSSGRSAFVSRTVWDNERDAREFYRAYVDVLARRFPQARSLARETERVALLADGYAVSVRLRADQVLLIFAPDEAILGTLDQALVKQ